MNAEHLYVASNLLATTPSHNLIYYKQCLFGGVLASSIRWALTPLEVIKGYSQIGFYSNSSSIRYNLKTLYRQEGVQGLFKGVGPTAIAYACQTGTKYSLYELFKDHITLLVGPDRAHEYKGLIYVLAAGTAEACADVLMCPWEQVRVQVQTSTPGSGFPTRIGPALQVMVRERNKLAFPFGSLKAVWGRQIPGTIANFYTFETIVQTMYKHVLTHPKESYSTAAQLSVTLGAGYLAGIVVSVVTHPADTLVSLMSKPEHRGKSMREIATQVGFVKLATKGLVPRMFTTGTIIGFQWWIYDSFKTAMGMGTSGG
jgi:solute carrier family 25 phosphate transporter 3